MFAWSAPVGRFTMLLAVFALVACVGTKTSTTDSGGAMAAAAPTDQDPVQFGRYLVISHACGDCHGGGTNPAAAGWMDGMRDTLFQRFLIGPFKTYARNLTPDNETGLGRFSERQIFNALRYGLRPGETPDVDITGTTPGQGNFPAVPKFLAPPMPWPSWRHMPDNELKAIAAYLKQGLKPVSHKVADSEGPPDFWASAYTVQALGPFPAAPYPTVNEGPPAAAAKN